VAVLKVVSLDIMILGALFQSPEYLDDLCMYFYTVSFNQNPKLDLCTYVCKQGTIPYLFMEALGSFAKAYERHMEVPQ
jgi:hypothetical protein